MKIITALPAADTSTAHSHPDELTLYHPVRSLFTLTVIEATAREATLRLRWRHPDPGAQGSGRGALGCVVDYAARFAAQPLLGHCDLSESELETYASFTTNTLLVTAGINVAYPECAIFHCTIHAVEKQHTILVASSRGTLLKRACD